MAEPQPTTKDLHSLAMGLRVDYQSSFRSHVGAAMICLPHAVSAYRASSM